MATSNVPLFMPSDVSVRFESFPTTTTDAKGRAVREDGYRETDIQKAKHDGKYEFVRCTLRVATAKLDVADVKQLAALGLDKGDVTTHILGQQMKRFGEFIHAKLVSQGIGLAGGMDVRLESDGQWLAVRLFRNKRATAEDLGVSADEWIAFACMG
jgi:hypothetical protein